jgi:hypothetical protein
MMEYRDMLILFAVERSVAGAGALHWRLAELCRDGVADPLRPNSHWTLAVVEEMQRYPPRSGNGGGGAGRAARSRGGQFNCSHHGVNASHNTDSCRILQRRKKDARGAAKGGGAD